MLMAHAVGSIGPWSRVDRQAYRSLMAKAAGVREQRRPSEVPKLARTGDGALTPGDIARVLTDESPAWSQLRRKLDRFRYCDTCDSWRSGVSASPLRPDDLECWICSSPLDALPED
jgi:hypothetical protein